MGIGKGSGKNRAVEAAAAAISSPLLDFSVNRAKGVVFNVVGGTDMTLQEINSAAEIIYEAVDPNANIIFGSTVDEAAQGEITITVIATGFPSDFDFDDKVLGPAAPMSDETLTSVKMKKGAQSHGDKDDESNVPDFLLRLRRRR
jgi:cell division protein FtsZ